MKWPSIIVVVLAFTLLPAGYSAGADSFYEQPPLFSTAPSPEKSLQTIARFGPVGMGIDLIQPAFTMKIHNIEEGSPAAASGKLEPGQIIESINGQNLKDIDPRIQLGQILAEAEATDGIVLFDICGQAEPVAVKIPVLGAYSKTWPLHCPKSDRIVRQVADYLAKPDSNKGIGGIGMLFLLSTGDDRDLEIVHAWARTVSAPKYPWHLGFGGVPLCECYLRTGDKELLPNIQQWVDNAVQTQYLDAWLGRGGVSPSYGNGHLNAAGTAVLTFLLLAKECGADVPDHALLGALIHFYRYAGRGNNPYGDHRTEVGFVDNGKNGNLAFAMAAAAGLTPDGESSVYAKARDACAMTSFYTTTFMLHGHTGGGIGEIWRGAAMGLLYDERPKQYRDFMDNRQWHYDLSRRFDGSFGILGGGGYDKELWGVAYPLAYTIPRKKLRIAGAPPTKFSKPYQLPKQPWGAQADNLFLSLDAVPDADGHRQDLSGETLAEDSSRPVLIRLHESGPIGDDLIRRYIHHQDHNIRFVAANKALGINSGYIGWREPGGKVRTDLVMEFLQHKDPRIRRAMFEAIYEILRREQRTEVLTRDVFERAVQEVAAVDGPWSVKDPALRVMGHAPADWAAPYVDLVLPYLEHEDWWLQNAALIALTPVVADGRCYRQVLPAIGKLLQTNQRSALTMGLMGSIRDKLKDAGPEVQQLAARTLKGSFTEFAGVTTEPGGQNVASTYDAHLKYIAASLADVPGGLDVLYEVARARYPNEILPYKELFLQADPSQFGPKLRQAIKPIILNELIPEFVGRNRTSLQQLAAAEVQSVHPGGTRDAVDGLAALYARAGQSDFDWHMFADLRNAEWFHYSFDPIPAEQVPWDQLITRYRPVTAPKGMEQWFSSDFDPVRAGWQAGKSPFAQYNGELPRQPITKCSTTCLGPGCFGATPPNTLWEKEVLLMHGQFKLPPLKASHRYRLRVNDGEHVGAGGGCIIYINGRPLVEIETCNGRGAGGLPKGGYITKEFLGDFAQGPVTIAVETFLRFNDKYKVKPSERIPQGKFSLHIEEQKLPPMGDDLIRKSATVVPMLSAEWQAAQDPEDRERQASAVKFQYDGRFVHDPELLGDWKAIGTVPAIEEFTPDKRLNPRSSKIASITFRANGETDSPTRIWSGDTLMDLTKYEALKMTRKGIDGQKFLFIEAGGFSERNPVGWKPAQYVFQRAP